MKEKIRIADILTALEQGIYFIDQAPQKYRRSTAGAP